MPGSSEQESDIDEAPDGASFFYFYEDCGRLFYCPTFHKNNPPADRVKQVVKTNPLALAFGNFNGAYERLLNDKSSIVVSANDLNRLFGVDVNALGAEAGWHYSFTNASKSVPAGFYIQSRASVSFGNVSEAKYTTVGIEAE